jgi:hypothetical protein
MVKKVTKVTRAEPAVDFIEICFVTTSDTKVAEVALYTLPKPL